MPTQKIASIPERVIPAKEVVLRGFEIGQGGSAALYFDGFSTMLSLSEDQQDRILAIVLESAGTDEVLKDATIADREVIAEPVAEPVDDMPA